MLCLFLLVELLFNTYINIHSNSLTVIGDKNVTSRSSVIIPSLSKISINGPFNCRVKWIVHEQTMDIYTDDNIHPHLIVNTANNTLEITIQFETNIKYTDMTIHLNLRPTIREIYLSGISTLYSVNVLKTDERFKLRTEETSSISLQVDVLSVDALVLSAGTTTLLGHVADKTIIKYNGIGDILASRLASKFVYVDANGLGTVWITAIEECFIKAEGVSIVRFNCPDLVYSQVTGLAKIVSV